MVVKTSSSSGFDCKFRLFTPGLQLANAFLDVYLQGWESYSGLSEFRVASITREIGRSLKFMVLSFQNKNRYANETCHDFSTGWVVSKNETRSGISSLVVEIYVALCGLRHISHLASWLRSHEKGKMPLHSDLEILHKCKKVKKVSIK